MGQVSYWWCQRVSSSKDPIKLQGNDQILDELIQAGGATLQFEIHKLNNSIHSKEELPD
jgi:hypothetical protein